MVAAFKVVTYCILQIVHHILQAVDLVLQAGDVGLVENLGHAGGGVPVGIHLGGTAATGTHRNLPLLRVVAHRHRDGHHRVVGIHRIAELRYRGVSTGRTLGTLRAGRTLRTLRTRFTLQPLRPWSP